MTLTYEMKHTAITSSVACSKPSICFVALRGYNILSGRSDITHIGGAEVQQLQMARWLARSDFRVSFVTLDYGQPDGTQVDGMKIFKAYAPETGLPGVRFVHPRWSGLWAALGRADADVYYQRGAELETGQVAMWCRLHRRKFIFAAACDTDCERSLSVLRSRKERVLYRIGLKLASGVTTQTATQRTLLRQNMRVESVLVRNCGWSAAHARVGEVSSVDGTRPVRVLWVGRLNEQKRLEWLLDVAERCPDVVFDVVGPSNGRSRYGSSLMERAASIQNVNMHGEVPYAEMATCYRRCDVLCCTSAYEGFPNTFLEAWSLGVPVITTFDPDGAVRANGLGWVASDVEGIVSCLKELAHSRGLWEEASKAAHRYYMANHTPEACLPAFEQLLLRVTGRRTDPT